jgi:4-hydroxybenzoate polyprenyl transferase
VCLGWLAIGLGVASLALVAAYPFMKRITWWPQAWLGLTFNWGALLGYAAATHELSWPAVLLYASGFFWTLGYDTIYAIQDIEDDALAGVKSSTRRLGEHVQKGVLAFYVACFVLVIAAAWVGGLGPLFLPLAALVAVHLSRQAVPGADRRPGRRPGPVQVQRPGRLRAVPGAGGGDVEAAGAVNPLSRLRRQAPPKGEIHRAVRRSQDPRPSGG